MTLEPNWLARELDHVRREIAAWPAWLRKEAGMSMSANPRPADRDAPSEDRDTDLERLNDFFCGEIDKLPLNRRAYCRYQLDRLIGAAREARDRADRAEGGFVLSKEEVQAVLRFICSFYDFYIAESRDEIAPLLSRLRAFVEKDQ